jgi:hypothetical protein
MENNKQPIFDFFMTIVGIGYWMWQQIYKFTQTETFEILVGAFATLGVFLLLNRLFC